MGALFTRLGFTAFGGPAAHIAMMRDEVVRRRGWLDDATFLDLVGATNLVPGPNSTELAVHLGLRRAGWRGAVAAALGFICPATLIVFVLAVLYDRYGTTPTALDLSYGIVPVIVAVVANATVGLTRTAIRDAALGVIAVATAVAWLVGVHELLLLVAAAVLGSVWRNRARLTGGRVPRLAPLPLAAWATSTATTAATEPDLARLAWVFVKVGAVLYGSGYVLVSFLQRDLVEHLGWLTEQQLLDAVAVGQFTPGPVFTTATFVGYQVAGPLGALVATVAIFTPAMVFVALLSRIVPYLRHSPWAAGALDGVNTASLGMMAAVLVRLAGHSLVDVLTVAIALVALAALWRWRVNSAWLVCAGAAIGVAHGALT